MVRPFRLCPCRMSVCSHRLFKGYLRRYFVDQLGYSLDDLLQTLEADDLNYRLHVRADHDTEAVYHRLAQLKQHPLALYTDFSKYVSKHGTPKKRDKLLDFSTKYTFVNITQPLGPCTYVSTDRKAKLLRSGGRKHQQQLAATTTAASPAHPSNSPIPVLDAVDATERDGDLDAVAPAAAPSAAPGDPDDGCGAGAGSPRPADWSGFLDGVRDGQFAEPFLGCYHHDPPEELN